MARRTAKADAFAELRPVLEGLNLAWAELGHIAEDGRVTRRNRKAIWDRIEAQTGVTRSGKVNKKPTEQGD